MYSQLFQSIIDLTGSYLGFQLNLKEYGGFSLNPVQPGVVFHIETNHLIRTANLMASFYMKCKTKLKCVNALGKK